MVAKGALSNVLDLSCSIHEGFQDSTLIVIAHQPSTVVIFDKILSSKGRVVEIEKPKAFMKRMEAFWEIVQRSE